MTRITAPSHPGRILKNLYLEPLGMGAIALAKRIGLPRSRIERLVKCKTGMTPDTAIRLARVFGTTPQYWINMQSNFDLAKAEAELDVSGIEPLAA